MQGTGYTRSLTRSPSASGRRIGARHLLPPVNAGGVFASLLATLFLLQFRGVSVPLHRISHEIFIAVAGTAVLKNVTIVFLLAERSGFHSYQSRLFARGEAMRRVAVAGDRSSAQE